MVNDETILTLLEDPDRRSGMEALRLLMGQKDQALAFIAAHQEHESELVRRRIHDLCCARALQERRERFITAVRERSLTFWDALRVFPTLIEADIREEDVDDSLDEFADVFFKDVPEDAVLTTERMIEVIHGSPLLEKRSIPSFSLGDYILCDKIPTVLTSNSIVLCEVIRQLGIRRKWYSGIVMMNGQPCLRADDGQILYPTHDWNLYPRSDEQPYSNCSNETLVMMYLELLYITAVMIQHPVMIYTLSDLLSALNRVPLREMPFPVGDRT